MSGLFPDRNKDVFGIGYFHTDLNSGFTDIVGPLLSALTMTRLNIEDTDGLEAYYRVQVTPWFAVTADLQVITKTLSTNDTKVVAGIRAKVSL